MNRLLKLRPTLNREDVYIQDNSDGKGPFIREWNSSLQQPTAEEIASVDDSLPDFVAWDILRKERNSHLGATDWTQMPDAPADGKAAWATYRQALRDLPANTPDPSNPTWPTSP